MITIKLNLEPERGGPTYSQLIQEAIKKILSESPGPYEMSSVGVYLAFRGPSDESKLFDMDHGQVVRVQLPDGSTDEFTLNEHDAGPEYKVIKSVTEVAELDVELTKALNSPADPDIMVLGIMAKRGWLS